MERLKICCSFPDGAHPHKVARKRDPPAGLSTGRDALLRVRGGERAARWSCRAKREGRRVPSPPGTGTGKRMASEMRWPSGQNQGKRAATHFRCSPSASLAPAGRDCPPYPSLHMGNTCLGVTPPSDQSESPSALQGTVPGRPLSPERSGGIGPIGVFPVFPVRFRGGPLHEPEMRPAAAIPQRALVRGAGVW